MPRLWLDLTDDELVLLEMAIQGYRRACANQITHNINNRRWKDQLIEWDSLKGKIRAALTE